MAAQTLAHRDPSLFARRLVGRLEAAGEQSHCGASGGHRNHASFDELGLWPPGRLAYPFTRAGANFGSGTTPATSPRIAAQRISRAGRAAETPQSAQRVCIRRGRFALRSSSEEKVMAHIMVATGASGLVCWFAVVLLLPRRPRRLASTPDLMPRNPSREEDRVRPAVTASGERIWIEPDELVWHEIVAWPELKAPARRNDVRRSA
jgi:hypothetical protein